MGSILDWDPPSDPADKPTNQENNQPTTESTNKVIWSVSPPLDISFCNDEGKTKPLSSLNGQRQHVTNLSEAHVLFDGVDASLEVGSGSVHVGDHGADVTDDGGKDQHAHLEEVRTSKSHAEY